MRCFRLLVVAAVATSMGRPATRPAQAEDQAPRPLWIAVTAPGLKEHMAPLAKRRAGQGFDIRILDDAKLRTDAQRVRRDIRPIRAAVSRILKADGPVRDHAEGANSSRDACVVLVGFDPLHAPVAADRRPFALPGGEGSADNMAGRPSDAVIADLDGDSRPDVMLGRLPARSPEELGQMVAKIVRFESATRPADWQHRFLLMAGRPGYGPVLDLLIESLAMSGLNRLDGRWIGRAFYDNPDSPLGGPAERLVPELKKALGEGAAVSLYMGHSSRGGFYLKLADFAGMKLSAGAGPMLFLSCSGGTQGGGEAGQWGGDGFAVVAMRNPNGPVATFAAAGVSYPHWNRLLAEGLLDHYLNRPAREQPPTIGPMLRTAVDNLATAKLDLVTRAALNFVDGSDADWPTQRRGHLEMYSLFGDPGTRWPWAAKLADLELVAPANLPPGQRTLRLSGRLAGGDLADATLTATVRKSWLSARARGVSGPGTEQLTIARAEGTAAGGRFELRLDLPERIDGRELIARVWAVGRNEAQAIGSRRIELQEEVKRNEKPTTPELR